MPILVTRSGDIITVTDGRRSRKALCAGTDEAKALEARLMGNLRLAKKWMLTLEPEQPDRLLEDRQER